MTIQLGEKIPSLTLHHMTTDGVKEISTGDIFDSNKVVLFALPGAFTPTCSAYHLPGYVSRAYELFAKGVDRIVCLSVNDAFVMGAWAKDQNVGASVLMLADGNGDFSKALGLELDASAFGMGLRCQRFAMVVDDGQVTTLNVEAPGAFEVSSAEAILATL